MKNQRNLREMSNKIGDTYSTKEIADTGYAVTFAPEMKMDIDLLDETLHALDERSDDEVAPHSVEVWHRIQNEKAGFHSLSWIMRRPVAVAMLVVLLLIAVSAVALTLLHQQMPTNGGIWEVNEGVITYQSNSGGRPVVVVEDPGIITSYVPQDSTGELYYLSKTEGGQLFYDVTTFGEHLYTPVRLNDIYNVKQFVGDISCFYVLMNSPSSVAGKVCCIGSWSSGDPVPMAGDGWENDRITSIAMYKDTLCVYSKETGLLSVFKEGVLQYKSVEVHDLNAVMPGYQIDDVDYVFGLVDSQGDKKLVVINAKTGGTKTVEAKLNNSSNGLTRDNDTLYVSGKSIDLQPFGITKLSGRKYDHQLTLVNIISGEDSIKATKAVELFNERYPDVEVVFRTIDDYRVLSTELMSGEPGIDVFEAQTTWLDLPPSMLVQKGYVKDMTDDPVMQAIRKEYRDIWGLVSADGHQYGVPDLTDYQLWQVNTELAAQLGWKIPELRWTWDDFESLAYKVDEWNQTAGNGHIYLIDDYFIWIYFDYEANHVSPYNGTADFETNTFIHLLDMYKWLMDHELINLNARYLSDDLLPNTLLGSKCISGYRCGHGMWILPPTENDESVYQVWITCYCANANSPYAEEAAYMLDCFASSKVTGLVPYYYDGQWLLDKSAYTTDNWAVYQGDSLDESITRRIDYLMEHCIQRVSIPGMENLFLIQLRPLLDSGEMSEQEFAQRIQEYADMFFGE